MTLHVRDYRGDGPPLVLLHGAGRSLTDWDAAAAQLGAGHRVLTVDQKNPSVRVVGAEDLTPSRC